MKKRDVIYNKFGGLCAYTGKPLGDDWQIDHKWPKCGGGNDDIENLFPAIKIINHYKRSHNVESFRLSMLSFHKRLSKLPKKTKVNRTIRRIEYMNTIARLFDITIDKPFSGKFYFETINN